MQSTSTAVARPNTQMTSAELAAQIKALQAQKRAVLEDEAKNKKTSPRGRGVLAAIKEVVFSDPTMTGDKLLAAVRTKIPDADKDGRKTSRMTTDTVRADFIHSLRFIKSKGVTLPEQFKNL